MKAIENNKEDAEGVGGVFFLVNLGNTTQQNMRLSVPIGTKGVKKVGL